MMSENILLKAGNTGTECYLRTHGACEKLRAGITHGTGEQVKE